MVEEGKGTAPDFGDFSEQIVSCPACGWTGSLYSFIKLHKCLPPEAAASPSATTPTKGCPRCGHNWKFGELGTEISKDRCTFHGCGCKHEWHAEARALTPETSLDGIERIAIRLSALVGLGTEGEHAHFEEALRDAYNLGYKAQSSRSEASPLETISADLLDEIVVAVINAGRTDEEKRWSTSGHQACVDEIVRRINKMGEERRSEASPSQPAPPTQFDDWWQKDGKFFDPDFSEVPWYDKREQLAEYAWHRATQPLIEALRGLLNLTDQGREGGMILSRYDQKPLTNGDQDIIDRAYIAAEKVLLARASQDTGNEKSVASAPPACNKCGRQMRQVGSKAPDTCWTCDCV